MDVIWPEWLGATVLITSYCVLLISIVLWFLFSCYFFAFLVKIIINLYIRFKQGSDAYFYIESLSLALYAGKVYFRKLQYTTKNGSIFIEEGYINLYWWFLLNPTWKNTKSQARLRFYFVGLEYIIYNNQEAYEHLEDLKKNKRPQVIDLSEIPFSKEDKSMFSWAKGIAMTIDKASIIFGNNKLATYMFIEFKKGVGLMSHQKPASEHDLFRFVFDMNCEGFIYGLRNNSILEEKKYVYDSLPNSPLKEQIKQHFTDFDKVQDLSKMYNQETLGPPHKYPFNHKYPDNYMKDMITIPGNEIIFQAKSFTFSYYYDQPGLVPLEIDSLNGDPPKYGLDITLDQLTNDQIVYGPWSDHARMLVQYYFWPSTFENMTKIEQLVGKLRKSERFDIKILFKSKVVWYFPFKRTPRTQREKNSNNPNREAFIVGFDGGSVIHWSSPQGALDESGAATIVDMNFRNVSCITTNTCKSFGETPDLHLKWNMKYGIEFNTFRPYKFEFIINGGKVYYLAEHVPFLQDLISHWRVYPNKTWPPVHNEFYPSKYTYVFVLNNAEILINANQNNIIDKQNDFDRNTFFCIRAPIFEFEVSSTQKKFQPEIYDYEYNIRVERNEKDMAKVGIRFPTNNPIGTRLKNSEWIMGEKVICNGHYLMHDESTGKLDSVTLNVEAWNATGTLQAWNLSYFVSLWFNNFSGQKYWVTSEEYKLNGHVNEKSKYIWNLKNTDSNSNLFPMNDIEYYVTVHITNGKINLPFNIYDPEDGKFAVAQLQEFKMDCRYVPTYIDMYFDLSPILVEFPMDDMKKKTSIGVNGVSMWNHLMVGAPPDSQYYKMMINLNIGAVSGDLTIHQMELGIRFLTNFVHQWKIAYPWSELLQFPSEYNRDRTWMPDVVSKYRATEFTIGLGNVNVGLICGTNGQIQLQLKNGLKYKYDKFNNGTTDTRSYLDVPDVLLHFLSPNELNQVIKGEHVSVGKLQSGIFLSVFTKPAHIEKHLKEQNAFLQHQDDTTRRLNIWDKTRTSVVSDISDKSPLIKPLEESNSPLASESILGVTQDDLTDDDETFYDVQETRTDDEYEDIESPSASKKEINVENIIIGGDDFEEDDDELIENFGIDKKKNMVIPLSAYHRMLYWYTFENESNIFSPLRFSSERKTKLGLFSWFPEQQMKCTNESLKINRIYQIKKSSETIVDSVKNKKRNQGPISLLSEDDVSTESTHYYLNIKDIDGFVAPNILQILQEIIKVFTNVKQNIHDIADSIEKKNYFVPENPHEPKQKLDWNFQNTMISASVNSINIQLIQSIFAPDFVKSPLLGTRITNSLMVNANMFFLVFSMGNKRINDFESSHYYSSGTILLKNASATMQCLNKKASLYEGVPYKDIQHLNVLPERPTILSISLDGFNLVGKYLIHGIDHQGRINVTTGKGIDLKFIRELPAILFSMIDLWKYGISVTIKLISENTSKANLEEVAFLNLLSRNDMKKETTKPRALKKMWNVILNMTQEEKTKFLSDLASKKVGNMLTLRNNIAQSLQCLLSPKEQPDVVTPTTSSSFLDKNVRTDLFIQIKQVTVSCYANAEKETNNTQGKVSDIVVRGKLDHGLHHVKAGSGKSPRDKPSRKTESTLAISVKHVSFDAFPETFGFVTCIIGVQALIMTKSNKELVTNLRRKAITRNQSFITPDQIPNLLEREFLNAVPKEKHKFYYFITLDVTKVEARAWTDKFNNAQLVISDISLIFNKAQQKTPLFVELQSQGKKDRRDLKLIHSGSLNVSKIKVQYNYSGENKLEYISLFDMTVSGLSLSEFWFKYQKSNVHAMFSVKGIHVNIPYTKIWKAATFQFRNFVQTWSNHITKRPHQPTTKQKMDKVVETSNQPELKIMSEWPSIQVNVDVSNVNVEAIILPNLQVKFNLSKVIANFNKPTTELSTFGFHMFSSSLSFKTNLNDSFPDELREIPDLNKRTMATNFKKKIILPEVYVSGSLKSVILDEKTQNTLSMSIAIEYMENVITSDLLNYILYIQSTVSKEVSSIIEEFTQVIQNKQVSELTQKIKTELPKAQESVKTLNMNYDIKLLMEGINVTALTSTTALVFNSGSTSVSVKYSSQGLKYKISLSNLMAEMIDTHNMKWSNKRIYQNKYSSTLDCYIWANFKTNLRIQNYDLSKEDDVVEKKFLIEITNTNVLARPGCIEQGTIMFKDYSEAIKNLRDAIQKNEDLQSEAISSLIKKGSEYYRYYSKEIVEKMSSRVRTQFISSGSVRILNSTISLPIGDNPYYGFLANENPSFSPSVILHVLIESIVCNAKSMTNDDINFDTTRTLLFKIHNVGAYFEESGTVSIPNAKALEQSWNRIRVDKVVLKAQVLTGPKDVKVISDGNINGPHVKANPSLYNYVAHFRNDWFNPKRKFYLDPIKISPGTTVAVTESTKVVKEATSQTKFYITGKVRIEPGKLNLYHALGSESLLQTIRKTMQDVEEGSLSMTTPLPSFDLDLIHMNPVSNRVTGPSGNTHCQISVQWAGAKLHPKSVVFFKEMIQSAQKYSQMSKLRSKMKLPQNPIRPKNWMNLLRSVIKIQRVWRGFSARKYYQQLKKTKLLKPSGSSLNLDIMEKKKDVIESSTSHTYSFYCRIQPFKVELQCSPIVDVVGTFEFTKPFDIIVTRTNMHDIVNELKEKNAIYTNLFLSSPEICLRVYHTLNPPDFAKFTLTGFKGNLGTAYGSYLRSDASVISGIISLENFQIDVNLPQITHFFIMYTLLMEKIKEADQLLDPNKFELTTPRQRTVKKKKLLEELALDATSCIFLQIGIKEIQLNTDLGTSIGKQKFIVQNTNLSVMDRGRFQDAIHREPMNITGYIGKINVSLTGRLKGSFTIDGLATGYSRVFQVGGKNPVHKGTSHLWIKILPITIDLDYNTDKVLFVKTGELDGLFQEKLDTPDGKTYHLQTLLSSDGVLIRIGKLTAPSVLRILLKLRDTIMEKRENAIEMIKSTIHLKNPNERIENTAVEAVKQFHIQTPKEMIVNLTANGDFVISCKSISVFLFDKFDQKKEELIPFGEWIEFNSETVKLTLGRQTDNESKIGRLLTVFLANVHIDKRTSRKKDFIIDVPGCLLEMESSQLIKSDEISYEYKTKFPGPIHVSTNLSDYSFLKDLIGAYASEVQSSLSDIENKNNSSVVLKKVNQESIKSPEIFPQRTFKGTMDLNPQIQVLGDLTPRVETVLGWWGIKDPNVIPRTTHNTITNALETLFVGCHSVTELMDKVFEEKKKLN